MSELKIWPGPVTNAIYIGRVGKRGDTLEKVDVTDDAINTVVHIIERSGSIELSKDGKPVKRLVLEDIE